MARYFTCACPGPKHGKLTGCSGTGGDFTGGLCAWCIAECRHRFVRDNQDVCHDCGQAEDAAIHALKEGLKLAE